jgi:hypothetical protein
MRPRFHQNTTSSAAGSAAATLFASTAAMNNATEGAVRVQVAPAIEAQIRERGSEEAGRRQRVLQLRHPRDGFDLNRVEREDECGEHSAAEPETTQDQREQERRRRVQRDVDQVIAGRGVAP